MTVVIIFSSAPRASDKAASPEAALYPAPKAATSLLLDVDYAGNAMVAVGDRGVIMRSEDGTDWTQVRSPVSSMINRLAFADASHGWSVGHDGVILHTEDGGKSWSLQSRDIESGQSYYDVIALSPERAIAVGSGTRIMGTRDGGDTWTHVGSGPLFESNWNFNAIGQLANGCILVAGERGLMARSCDEGSDWEQLQSPYVGSFYGVFPVGDAGAAIFGMRGHVFVTDDVYALPSEDSETWDPYLVDSVDDSAELAATGWRRISTPVEQSLYGGVVDEKGYAVIGGVGGSILTGDLAGNSMQRIPNRSGAPISAVLLQDQTIITVGREGVRQVPVNP